MIRQLDGLHKIMEQTSAPARRQVLLEQATMIQRSCDASVPEEADRLDVRRRYRALLALRDDVEPAPAES